MILGEARIANELDTSRMVGLVQPASIDLRIAKRYLLPNCPPRWLHRIGEEITYREVTANPDIIVKPKQFVLAATQGTIDLPLNIAGWVEGRSSIGRAGLFVQNAGWIDPGFCGSITLELYNANEWAIAIPVGTRICQVVFCDVSHNMGYIGKYQSQTDPVGYIPDATL